MGETPYLRLDAAVMDANIAAMAAHAQTSGFALRPHAKTHKCPQIAARQLAAGAVGLTVATIGEAEVFAEAGARDLFIAYPLWVDSDDARRLRSLVAEDVRVAVGCDSESAADNLAGLPIEVMVEIDSGHHRSGVDPHRAGGIATRLSGLGAHTRGVFTFPGHAYSPTGRQSAAEDEARTLIEAGDSLRSVGLVEPVLSGGSSPSALLSAPPLTELRPGVYVFGDAQQVELGAMTFEQVALTVVSRVVSHAGGRVICDAGSKALGADRAPWASGFGRVLGLPEARIVALSEHHATIDWPAPLPALGSTIAIVPNHACNAVNLADAYVLADGGRWPVTARGRNH